MSAGDFILWSLLVIATGTLVMTIMIDPSMFFSGRDDDEER